MLKLQNRSWFRLAGAAAVLSLTLPAMAAQVSRSLVVFPPDKPESVDQAVADTVQNGLRSRLDRTGAYEATTFYAKSPLVQRAISSNAITQDQLNGPFTAETGAAIAKALDTDYALVGSIVDANVDTTAKKATVTVTAQLVSAVDGKPVKTAGVTGEATNATLAPDALLRLAADNAADKASVQLFGTPAGRTGRNGTAPVVPPTPGVTTPGTATPGTTATNGAGTTPGAPAGLPTGQIPVEGGRRSKRGSSSLLILGGLALIAIIASSSHSSGGGGNGGGGNGGGGNPPGYPF